MTCSRASRRWAARCRPSRPGYIQRQVQESAYKAQMAIDAGEAVVVGVNRYQTDDRSSIEVFRMDPELERQQVARVRAVRAARDHAAWRSALDAVASAAQGRDNLVPRVVAAVEAARNRRRNRGYAAGRVRRVPRSQPGLKSRMSEPLLSVSQA